MSFTFFCKSSKKSEDCFSFFYLMALGTKLVYLVTVFLGVTVKIIVRLEKNIEPNAALLTCF